MIREGTVEYGENKQCRAYCKPIGKWELAEGKWREPTEQEVGTAFSIVSYDTTFGKRKNEEEFEMIFIVGGKRTENYSEKGNGTGWGVQKYLDFFDKMDKNIRVVSILVDKDGPLEEEAKLMAERINHMKGVSKCKKVHYLGVSKGGTMAGALLKYLTEEELDKVHLISCFAPWRGTILASPVLLYKKIDQVMAQAKTDVKGLIKKIIPHVAKIKPHEENAELDDLTESSPLGKRIKRIHWRVFSQSHMDYDIVPVEEGPEGIPTKHLGRYDNNYLRGMFGEKTLQMLGKVKFTNVTTYCTKQTRQAAIKSRNLNAALLSIADELLFDTPSDGMVTEESAKYIEQVAEEHGIPIIAMRIFNGHHDIETDSTMIECIVQNIIQKDIGKEEEEK